MNNLRPEHYSAINVLHKDQPTDLSFKDLFTWIIWQFPKPKGNGMCGAVRPPIAKHTWYPALIKQREKRVQVHGHLDQEFTSAKAAADWIENN